ncbi:MAG: alpha/beta hydrolase [candidate division Zixibacteria bacterium]|nr:alpha/beta hydrolase [candidate division Zixibacteria bacterium]
MSLLETENLQLYYETLGQGEPLVLIHGIVTDSRYWLDLPQFLSKRFTVITYDLRGHGQSSVPTTGYSYRDHVNDLKLLLNELGFKKTTIVAHSLGGAIAVKYAIEAPEHVKALALAAPHIVGYKDYTDWPNVYRTARQIDVDQARIQWEQFRLFSKLDRQSPEWAVFKTTLAEFPGKLWLDQQAGRYIDESDMKLLDNLTMPVLLLCGRDDLDFLPLAKLFNARLSNGTLFEIPECGHMIHLEKPEIFRRELAAFLKL